MTLSVELGAQGVSRAGLRGEPLAALAGHALCARFATWRGAGGRRYLFSACGGRSAPHYEDALVMALRIDADGEATAVALVETGTVPELRTLTGFRAAALAAGANAWAVHLVSEDEPARRAAYRDLVAGLGLEALGPSSAAIALA
ncbi:MAG: hypothetical protein KGI57_04285 [Hyphomicrobiales bacterium]|nr:hypothetical protein [Hyphomicrobiales bacterium]MDE2016906.1 hypothetical protein [Hyphomicrobiales bacterium]